MRKFCTAMLATLGALGFTAIACYGSGSFLHRAAYGEFCAHGHKYVVKDDGSIQIETFGYPTAGVSYYSYSATPPEKSWQIDESFSSVEDLHNVIGDLQKIEADIRAADKDVSSGANCPPSATCGGN